MVRQGKLLLSETYMPLASIYGDRNSIYCRRSCRQDKYRTTTRPPPLPMPSMMSSAPSRRRWWTQEEDHILQEEVKNQLHLGGHQGPRNWSTIAEKLPGRSNKDCRKRWTKISLSSRKGTWSSAEDHLLRKAVAKFGFQWTKVAEMVGSRHPDQCAKRWHHSLDPNVKRDPWTTEEDNSLIGAVHRIGRDWKEIGRELFPDRSTTDIKNRYVILSRRQGLSSYRQTRHETKSLVEGKSFTPMNMFSPHMDPSLATTPCSLNISNLDGDGSAMPLPVDASPYVFSDASSSAFSNANLRENEISACDAPDWAAFEDKQLILASHLQLTPDKFAASETDSCDPRLLTISSHPGMPSVSENPRLSAPSTLVLEELEPETVNLVIDTLLKTNSRFGMQLYKGGL
ncbi:SANT/Myb-like DNA-binding domain-containing protein [Aspergillus undulatus]|uniref:SANT/Myb-like DNA-binding domain-containing protein n=1 Tax=Aspergillus undulatus TaxID=1810928 RepID=UPI003CCD1C36